MKQGKFLSITIFSLLLSVVVSLFLTGVNALHSVIVGKAVEFWKPFLGGAVGLFLFLFLYNTINIIVLAIRYRKDPTFAKMNQTTGIRWRDYQELKNNRT